MVSRRFHQLWRALHPRRDDFRYVIAADVRDVIFQGIRRTGWRSTWAG
jgi:hypothetical protein